ncbi:hypothetical protein GCM10027033_24870 [Leucobacter ruminantium]
MQHNDSFYDWLVKVAARPIVDETRGRVAARARATAPVGEGDYKNGIKETSKMQERYIGLVQATDPKSLIVESKTGNLARALRGSRRGR